MTSINSIICCLWILAVITMLQTSAVQEPDELNELASISMDYYDQNYGDSEELPQPKAPLPDIFCNTYDELSEDSTHVYVTSCSYATAENLHTYHINQFYIPHERHLKFSYSNVEYITPYSFNSDDPLAMGFNIKITVLDLQKVNLQTLESNALHSLSNLEDLNLNGNKLTSLENGVFNSLSKLMYLDLSNNKLSGYLDWRNLTGLGSSLINLDLSNNRIKFVRKHSFFNLTGLETLNLSSNRLAIIPAYLFQYNTLLTNIFLSNNTITIIGNGTFAYLSKIHDLDLSNNKLLHLPGMVFSSTNSSTENINSFNVEHNLLDDITETIQNIEINELLIQGNHIQGIYGGNFCDRLDISYIGLKFLSNISMCNSGSAILASHNQLQDIPFMYDVGTVSIVELQYNNISHLPAGRFSEFHRLVTLRLDKNELTKLEVGLFTSLDNLRSLNISFNKLEHVNQKVFYGLWQLETLYLGGNNLKTLPAVLILQRLRSLKLLGLNHNPWDCSELMEILHVLDMNNIQMAHHVKINYHTTNIGGVECTENHESQENVLKIETKNSSSTESKINEITTILDVTIASADKFSTIELNPSDSLEITSDLIPTTTEVTTIDSETATDDNTEYAPPIIPIINKTAVIADFDENSLDAYTEKSSLAKLQNTMNRMEQGHPEQYRNTFIKEGPEIRDEMSSMKSSIYEMKAVLIIGILLIACMICIKLYSFYRKNMKPHVVTATTQNYHDSSIQSITTEIEM